MNALDQIAMFEPHGQDLAKLVGFHLSVSERESRIADNLTASGFASASRSHLALAADSFELAMVCEITLQFETLAGLS